MIKVLDEQARNDENKPVFWTTMNPIVRSWISLKR